MSAYWNIKHGDLIRLQRGISRLELFEGNDPQELSSSRVFTLKHGTVCVVISTHNDWLIQVMTPNGKSGWEERRWFTKIT